MIFVTSSSTYAKRETHQYEDQETRSPASQSVEAMQLKSVEMTHLHVLERVLLGNTPQHILFAAFLEFSRQKEFVEDVVGLGEGEDDIKLADVAVVLVHLFDVAVNDLEADQFIVVGGATGDEEQGGISTVDNFCVCKSQLAQ